MKLVSGGLSGLISQTVTYPIDVIRRRMQADGFLKPEQMPGGGVTAAAAAATAEGEGVAGSVATGQAQRRTYVGIGQTAALIVRNEGWRGLFKGVSVNWLKGPITIGISFTCFDKFKQMLDVQEPREQ